MSFKYAKTKICVHDSFFFNLIPNFFYGFRQMNGLWKAFVKKCAMISSTLHGR